MRIFLATFLLMIFAGPATAEERTVILTLIDGFAPDDEGMHTILYTWGPVSPQDRS